MPDTKYEHPDLYLVEKLNLYSKKLQSATKKADKTSLLLEAKNDEGIQKFLDFVLNPRIVTGISAKKMAYDTPLNAVFNEVHDFFSACEYLKENNTGRLIDLAIIQNYINNFDSDDAEFLKRVFTKNLPLGVDVKTVNKTLGFTLIPDWQVQQAYLIEKYPVKDGEWFSISQKMNGTHCSWYRGDLISRQGTIFTGLDHIASEIRMVAKTADEMFFDGELIRKNDGTLSDNENFRIGTGLANSKDADKSSLEFVIYDMLPADEFERGRSKFTYMSRLQQLNALETCIQLAGCKSIRVVPRVYNGTDKSKINQWLDFAVEHDWEGVMVNLDRPYRCIRHNGILKVKRFYTMDLRVIGLEEGTNRLSGTLGALVVDYKGNEVHVGSGFDDETRRKIWNNQDSYIDKLAEIQYKDVSKDKRTGKESLQFPTFKMFRFDKDDVSFD